MDKNMPLNKQDLKSIEGLLDRKFDEKLEPFATAIQEDISKLGSRLEEVEKRLTDRLIKLEDDTSYLRNNAKFIEDRIDELKEELKQELKNKPNKEKIDEIEKQVIDLETRVSNIESQNS